MLAYRWTVTMSVRPSFRLSHFNIISKRLKLNTPLKLFHIFNSPVTLVFKTTPSSQNSEGIIHNEGVYVASLCITLHQEFLTWSKRTPQGPQRNTKTRMMMQAEYKNALPNNWLYIESGARYRQAWLLCAVVLIYRMAWYPMTLHGR